MKCLELLETRAFKVFENWIKLSMQLYILLFFVFLCFFCEPSNVLSAENNSISKTEHFELASKSPLLGGWTGKIGKHPVMVCFAPNNSSYYYLKQLGEGVGLLLFAMDREGHSWRETEMTSKNQKPTGVWSLNTPAGDIIEGKWNNLQGKSTLPIKLERNKKSKGVQKGCDFQSMQVALGLNPARVSESTEQEISGIRFRFLSALDGTVSTIRFTETSNAAHNKKLNDAFRSEIQHGLECQEIMSTSDSMLEWPTSYSIKPVSVHAARWVTLNETASGYCGGAYPYSNSSMTTVELSTGEPVNFASWVKRNKNGGLPSKLLRLVNTRILKLLHARRGEDCDGIYIGGDNGEGDFPGYAISLGNHGLVFSKLLPHVVVACSETVEIPYDELKPFFTKAGMDAMSLLQSR